jgi:hypothetical protein
MELRKILGFLELDYETVVAEGYVNSGGILLHEYK